MQPTANMDREHPPHEEERDAESPEPAPPGEPRPHPEGRGWRRRARRVAIGSGAFLFGSAGMLLLMANLERLPHGALLGLVCDLVAAFGLLWATGLLTPDPERDAISIAETAFARQDGEPRWRTPAVWTGLSLGIVCLGAILGGYEGLPLTLALGLAALLPPALRRPGLLVFVLISLAYLPLLGVHALWDPWETHYAEVAREILSRDDWISLWWAQDGWFWSKPVLIFWTEALSMSAFGVDPTPDANPAHPEWALRLPVFMMSVAAIMAVYGTLRRLVRPRAGVLAALVVATMPHFFLLAHQSITDMPLVSHVTIALCLLLLTFAEDPEREASVFRLGRLRFSLRSAMVGIVAMLGLPQALYLISRNVTMVEPFLFHWHRDQFLHGSAGNEGVAGNAPLRQEQPAIDLSLGGEGGVDLLQPGFQGLFWLILLAGCLYGVARDRRTQSLYMVGFYAACALAFLAKGIPGFAIPGLVALLYLVGSGRWATLLEGRLRVGFGALLIATLGLPWYVAMYVRHGRPFFDRLFIHDHINRLASGVHGDEGSVQYFLQQLGYATFPWVALVPAALSAFLWYRGPGRLAASHRGAGLAPGYDHPKEAVRFFTLWAIATFVLFSAMATKFHHYIFPMIPALGTLVGLSLDRLYGEETKGQEVGLGGLIGTLLAYVWPLPMALGLAGARGDVRGRIPAGVESARWAEWTLDHPWPTSAVLACLAAGALLLATSLYLARHLRAPARHVSFTLGGAALSGAIVLAFVARDMSWDTMTRPGGSERLTHLFVYNYGRPFPEHFDYRAILSGFGAVAVFAAVAMVLRRLQPVMSRALVGLALAFTAWGVDVYMTDLADHWSIRPLVQRYYEEREGPEQPLVAWQMNWKGENFYTGNRVHVFVQLDSRAVRAWMEENPGTTAYFALERGRLRGFRGLIGEREVEELTTERECNKFVLVRVAL